MNTLSWIFFGLSLAFISASVFTGSNRKVFGVKRMKSYYYTGTIFMGLTLFLLLTLENGLSVEAVIFPMLLMIMMIMLFKINMFMQTLVEKQVGETSFSSLVSRLENFIGLFKK